MIHSTNSGRTQGQPQSFSVLDSAARTATPTTAFLPNPGNFRGVKIFVEATASANTPSVVVTIQVKNHRTGTYHTVLTSAAITGASNNVYEVYPGGAAIANLRTTYHVGRGIRVVLTHGDADSITYSVDGEWIP